MWITKFNFNFCIRKEYIIMKKLLSIILAVMLVASLGIMASASDIENGPGNGDWEKKSDDSIVCTWGEGLLAGSGGYYQLGLADSFELTMSLDKCWRAGIIFGVNDVTEDGYIEQNEDQYILVCFRDSETYGLDNMIVTDVGVEINDGHWGGWVIEKEPNDKENNPIGYFGDGLKVKIAYSEGTLEVYAAGGHDPDTDFERGEDEWQLVWSKTELTTFGRGFGLWCKTNDDKNYSEQLFENVKFVADGVEGKIPDAKVEAPVTTETSTTTTTPNTTTKAPTTTNAPTATTTANNDATTESPDGPNVGLIIGIVAVAVVAVGVVVFVVVKKK